MANEISISATLAIAKSGATAKGSATDRITMSGAQMIQTTQNIGTSAEALTWGEISGAPKYAYLYNMDSTNFVTIGWTNPPTEIKLLAGEFCLLPSTTATMYAKADTAAINLFKVACEA